jgi:hypothetical protein
MLAAMGGRIHFFAALRPPIKPYGALNHECTRIDTNETDFVVPYPNQPPNGERGAFSANPVHSPDIRVHSCPFVVSVCLTRIGIRLTDTGGHLEVLAQRAPRFFVPVKTERETWAASVGRADRPNAGSDRYARPRIRAHGNHVALAISYSTHSFAEIKEI